ncbi:arylamine N-acetyltransferase [Micromonospora sp. KC207]|uniref:arylamine N-acetyltransferase family protein n=1 Tax=Micromonospora sp. KC207 TaxID=2530377 RepID=UPI00140512CD|nr:arylamine N-acetyltransferase [Micromonospora sp. KC207]
MESAIGKTDVALLDAYLGRLGVTVSGPPSPTLLSELHRAHVERIAWHNLDIAGGVDTDPDPVSAAARIAAGRGGHCFELNNAFALLLRELGFNVRTHRAGIHGRYQRESPGATGTHLVLSVSGLPAPEAADGVWLVDVAAGDLLHEPVPLHPGEYDNGGYRIALTRESTEAGGWRVDHDKRGGSRGVEISPDPHPTADQIRCLRFLTHDAHSPMRFSTLVQRRYSVGADILFGPVLTGPAGSVEITSREQWLAALTDVFHLRVDLFDPAVLDRLWRRAAQVRPMLRGR